MRQIGFVRVEEQKLRPGKEGIESGGWLRAKTKHSDCLQMTEACVCSLWSPGFKQGSQGNGNQFTEGKQHIPSRVLSSSNV